MSDWVVEPKPVPPELVHPEQHADFTLTPVADSLRGFTVEQRIDTVMRERLKEMFGQVR